MNKREAKEAIIELINFYGKLPELNVIASRLQMNIQDTQKILEALDFMEVKEKPKKVVRKKKTQKREIDVFLIIIRSLLGCVSIIASGLSLYFTALWVNEFFAIELAYCLSAAMIIFSVLAFQLIIFIYNNYKKRSKIILIISLSILWIIVIFFSMFSTVVGQYNLRAVSREQEIREQPTRVISLQVLEQLEIQLSEIDIEIQARRDVRAAQQRIIDEIASLPLAEQIEYQARYNTAWTQLNSMSGVINGLTEQRAVIQSRIQELLVSQEDAIIAEEVAVVRDAYQWVADQVHGDKYTIEFVMSIFPALFIDIIAPIGAAGALFLRRRKEHDQEA